jgi:membrane-bound lytic murein transglycosylase MltF
MNGRLKVRHYEPGAFFTAGFRKVNRISNNLINDIASRGARIMFLAILVMLSACSDPQGTAQPEESVDPQQESTAVTRVDPEVKGQGEQPEESLSSLDDLLPEQFGALTAAWSGDLDGMAKRRVIRTLVISGGPQFFYYEGRPRGMIAELLGLLQQEMNVGLNRGLDQVEIIPMPVSRDRLIPALINGQADLIAADLTITDARSELVDYSDPLARNIDEIVVFAPGKGENVKSLDDLAGHRVFVRKSSSYFEHITAINDDMVARGLEPIRIEPANEFLRSQDILEMVNAGLVAATVVDSYKASSWSKIFTDMQVREELVVHAGGEIAWAFRKDSPQLAAVINDFARGHRQGTLIGNVLIKRYMGNLGWVRNSTSDSGVQRLRPLLEHFSSSGVENNLDPLMLAAQAYQESELDHDRESPAGAVGIMQIKPSTAADRNVGIDDISRPADNIEAGARYMRFLIDRYFSDAEMEETQRWLFALAAYNAGPAKVQRLRNQAAAEGHDPNVWLNNVELIAARKIGRETVRYVRNIFKYYVAYRLAWEDHELRRSIGGVSDRKLNEEVASYLLR